MSEELDNQLKQIIIKIEEDRKEIEYCRTFVNSYLFDIHQQLKTPEEKYWVDMLEKNLNDIENLRDSLEENTHIKLREILKKMNLKDDGKEFLKIYDKTKIKMKYKKKD